MARPKTKRTIIEEEVPEVEQRFQADPDEIAAMDALEEFGRSFGASDINYKVHRIVGNKTEFIYAGSDRVDELWLQQHYPEGGEYQITATAPNGMSRSVRVLIARSANPAPAPGGGDLEIRLLRQQMDFLTQQLVSRQNAPQSSAVELAQAVAALHQIGGNNNGGGASETLKLAMEIAKMIKGVPEADDSFMGVIKDVAKTAAAPLLSGFLASRAAAPVAPNGNPNGVQSMPVTADPLEAAIRQGIGWLKKKALAGADPGLYIDLVFDNRDDERLQPVLHAILTQEFDVFASIDPEIQQPPYLQFFKGLYDGLRSAFTQQDPVDGDSRGPRRDDDDTPGDAPLGKKRG